MTHGNEFDGMGMDGGLIARTSLNLMGLVTVVKAGTSLTMVPNLKTAISRDNALWKNPNPNHCFSILTGAASTWD